MKKILFSLLFLLMILPAPEPALARGPAGVCTAAAAKPGPRKHRKGFLWGLFSKKDKNCGCPKH